MFYSANNEHKSTRRLEEERFAFVIEFSMLSALFLCLLLLVVLFYLKILNYKITNISNKNTFDTSKYVFYFNI